MISPNRLGTDYVPSLATFPPSLFRYLCSHHSFLTKNTVLSICLKPAISTGYKTIY